MEYQTYGFTAEVNEVTYFGSIVLLYIKHFYVTQTLTTDGSSGDSITLMYRLPA